MKSVWFIPQPLNPSLLSSLSATMAIEGAATLERETGSDLGLEDRRRNEEKARSTNGERGGDRPVVGTREMERGERK